jgi:predicted AAA+ superfamily ATPase
MDRFALAKIEAWNKAEPRKPLILMGARQVGKTWLMDAFAAKHYPFDTVSINLMQHEKLRTLFETIDLEPKLILDAISIATHKRIEPGKTLLIIDEIQESPRALTSLKFFNEQMPELAIIVAGSLLGLALNRKKRRGKKAEEPVSRASFPVGKVSFLDIGPMTFEEFLTAVGEDAKCEVLRNRNWELVSMFHDSFCELLKRYFFVGGMPEAVSAYLKRGDMMSVRSAQREILRAYDEDFAKHADGVLLDKVRLLWRSIPAQLAKENKKFVYTALRPGARAREYEQALDWLDNAGMVHKVHNVSTPLLPLPGYEEFGAFKLYAHDVGLLGAMTGLSQDILLEKNEMFTHYKGALTEQFVAEELSSYGIDLHYWSPDEGKAEIEFLSQIGDALYPIEAKSEINLQAKSLGSYIRRYNPSKALRLSMSVRDSGSKVEDYPLYSIHEMLIDLVG